MRTIFPKVPNRGLTLVEALLVIVVVFILAVLFVPRLHRPHPKLSCTNNLKQVCVAFRFWAGDNNERYPMQVSTNDGGTMEYLGTLDVFRHFLVMSNELNTPKILFCPQESDSKRTMATTFLSSTPPKTPWAVPFTGNANISYFVGLDASSNQPQALLSGDRNITLDGVVLSPGLHAVRTNDLTGWSRAIHRNVGNLLLEEGSVQTLYSTQMPGFFRASGIATNRLAIP